MRRYIAVRMVSLIPILFGVSLLVFAMQALVPGDIVDIMMGGDQAFGELRFARPDTPQDEGPSPRRRTGRPGYDPAAASPSTMSTALYATCRPIGAQSEPLRALCTVATRPIGPVTGS